MDRKMAVIISVLFVLLPAHAADAQQPAAPRGLTLQSPEVRSAQKCDGTFLLVPIHLEVPVIRQHDRQTMDEKRKRITGMALNRLEASCIKAPSVGLVKFNYPIEKVGVLARSVTFPSVLNHGQGILDTNFPNASIFCLEVVSYSGLVTGLIWSTDRELVEEYGLENLIDHASKLAFTCTGMFMPLEHSKDRVDQNIRKGLLGGYVKTASDVEVQLANLDAGPPVSQEIEEKTPAVSVQNAQKAVFGQIEKIQQLLRFAQTVKSKQND